MRAPRHKLRDGDVDTLVDRPRLRARTTHSLRSGIAVLALCSGALCTATSHAQEAVRVAVFPSASSDPRGAEMASAVDAAVIECVQARRELSVAARPAVDLQATALALGCDADTRECLATIVREAGVDALIASSVTRDRTGTTIELTYIDGRADAAVRRSTRRLQAGASGARVIDTTAGMLRDMLPSGEVLQPASKPAQLALTSSSRDQPAARAGGLPVGPIALAAVGVAFVGVGVGFGIAAHASEDDYRRAPTRTMSEVQSALGKLSTARDQSRLANIGFGIGAAAMLAGAVWMTVDLSARDGSEVALSARASPTDLGLVLRGDLGRSTW